METKLKNFIENVVGEMVAETTATILLKLFDPNFDERSAIQSRIDSNKDARKRVDAFAKTLEPLSDEDKNVLSNFHIASDTILQNYIQNLSDWKGE